MKKLLFAGIGVLILNVGALMAAGVLQNEGAGQKRAKELEDKFSGITWVAYSPPSANPEQGIEATKKAIQEDLALLLRAEFTGLVTYTSSGVVGREVPKIAEALGFKGVILGVWDPQSREEIAAAKRAAGQAVVLGFCVGNEGLGKRYQLEELASAIDDLRKATGKPVTTTEEIDDYADEALLKLGDWVFPNAHPYFHERFEPQSAVRWTEGAFRDLSQKAKRFVLFKEVGLPTDGDPQGRMTEQAQEHYYLELAKTKVSFVYFEAFDQPWKRHLPVEPHWGIYRADRSPKQLAMHLMEGVTAAPSDATAGAFYVYLDADSPKNHFKPTGYMGDCGDIHIDEVCEVNPHSGETCIKVVYEANGKGPNECSYSPPCKWAGTYWQNPPNNWGKESRFKRKGFDLSKYKRLSFWARADKACRIEFKVAGIDERYGDSLRYPRSKTAKLGAKWKEFTIPLEGTDLSHIIGGFCWASNWDSNPNGATFYIDDVRFE